MTGEEFIYYSAALGYFLAGMFTVIGLGEKPDRPAFLRNFTLPKKLLTGVLWFIPAFLDIYQIHLPAKARAFVHGLLNPPVSWIGFSCLAALILLPHYIMESNILAVLISIVLFFAGAALLAPWIAMGSGMVAYVLAQPIAMFLPKVRNVEYPMKEEKITSKVDGSIGTYQPPPKYYSKD